VYVTRQNAKDTFLSEASDLSLKTLSQASPGACNLNFS
jgi:hypothetical protein